MATATKISCAPGSLRHLHGFDLQKALRSVVARSFAPNPTNTEILRSKARPISTRCPWGGPRLPSTSFGTHMSASECCCSPVAPYPSLAFTSSTNKGTELHNYAKAFFSKTQPATGRSRRGGSRCPKRITKSPARAAERSQPPRHARDPWRPPRRRVLRRAASSSSISPSSSPPSSARRRAGRTRSGRSASRGRAGLAPPTAMPPWTSTPATSPTSYRPRRSRSRSSSSSPTGRPLSPLTRLIRLFLLLLPMIRCGWVRSDSISASVLGWQTGWKLRSSGEHGLMGS